MLRALNPFAPFWYVPMAEKETEVPTRFKLRGLNGSELGYVSPELIVDETQRMVTGLSGKGADLTLRYGLIEWENFENDEGAVAFNPRNFTLIPYEIRAELAMQIIAASYVKEAQKKT